MCSDNSILKEKFEDEVIVNSNLKPEVLKFKNDSLKKVTAEKRNLELEKVRKEWTANAYQLGFSGYSDFKVSDFKDWTFYPSLCFTLFILLSVIVFFCALKESFIRVMKLSILNLSFILCSMIIFIVKDGIDIISQIRYGYYLLLCNILLLIILSKIEIKRAKKSL
jgi:hypothetical protein